MCSRRLHHTLASPQVLAPPPDFFCSSLLLFFSLVSFFSNFSHLLSTPLFLIFSPISSISHILPLFLFYHLFLISSLNFSLTSLPPHLYSLSFIRFSFPIPPPSHLSCLSSSCSSPLFPILPFPSYSFLSRLSSFPRPLPYFILLSQCHPRAHGTRLPWPCPSVRQDHLRLAQSQDFKAYNALYPSQTLP